MTAATGPVAISLARDARHTMAGPALLVLIGLAIGVPGTGLGLALGITPVVLLAAVVGITLAVIGVSMAVRTRSLKLVVEVDYLHLTGIGVDRRYHLAHGSLSRVATSGPSGAQLRMRPTALGWAVGQSTLGSGERIDVIRLGATPSLILVPTEGGRVALAPAVEADLIQALMGAAQTRSEREPAPAPPPAAPMPASVPASVPTALVPTASVVTPPISTVGTAVIAAAVAPPIPRAPEPEAPRRPLTGIERMALEEQMALERRAALAGAQQEQAMASFSAAAAISPPSSRAITYPTTAPPSVAPTPDIPPVTVAPAEAPAPIPAAALPAIAAATAAPVVATTVPSRSSTRSFPLTVPRGLPRRRPLRPMAWRASRPTLGREIALLASPLAAAGVVWFMAALVGATANGQGLDPLNFALLLCGPVAVVAILLARTRWPRLAGLSSLAAVISLALVARAVIG